MANLRGVLIGGLLLGVIVLGQPAAPAEDVRTGAWRLYQEIVRDAKMAKEQVPLWLIWCEPEILRSERCKHDFQYPKGLNVRQSAQAPHPPSAPAAPEQRTTVHMNAPIARAVRQFGKGWLLSSADQRDYMRDGVVPLGLFPPPQKQHLGNAASIRRNVPIAVKAAWWVFHPATVCADPASAKMPVWSESKAPADKSKPYDPVEWPDSVTIAFTRQLLRDCPNYVAPPGSVPVDEFYHFESLQAMEGTYSVPPGAIAVLAALHIASRQTERWVWTTLWWEQDLKHPLAIGRPAGLPSRWSHYVLQVSADQDGHIYNPYLEAGMRDGRRSNCMSCHRLAAVGRTVTGACVGPVTEQALRATPGRVVLTDYLWALVLSRSRGIPWDCNALAASQ